MTDRDKRPTLFDDDMLIDIEEPVSTDNNQKSDTEQALQDVQEGNIYDKILDSSENQTRSEQNEELSKKEKKKSKKEKKQYTPEELEAIHQERKKTKKRRRIIGLIALLLFIGASTSTYMFLNNKVGKTEANKELLYSKYKDVFVDEEYTEITKDLSKKKVDEITELYNTIPNGSSKLQFKNWQETMVEQYNNQENAKTLLADLYEGSNTYIGENVNDKQIQETEGAIKLKFNSEYQNELLKEFEVLKGQYNLMSESVKAVNSLFNNKKEVNELSQAELENIKAKIEKNPNEQLKNKQMTKYDGAYKQWSEREEKRRAEAERIEAERLEQERIAQEKALEEARKQAEYEAQLEAEREKVRQEEYRKQQEEQARIDAENQRKNEEEQRRKEQEEQKRKEQEEAQKEKEKEEQNNTNNSEK